MDFESEVVPLRDTDASEARSEPSACRRHVLIRCDVAALALAAGASRLTGMWSQVPPGGEA